MRFPRSSSIRTEGRRSFIYDLTNWSAVVADGTHSRVSLTPVPVKTKRPLIRPSSVCAKHSMDIVEGPFSLRKY